MRKMMTMVKIIIIKHKHKRGAVAGANRRGWGKERILRGKEDLSSYTYNILFEIH
jgi:hypothetical protein